MTWNTEGSCITQHGLQGTADQSWKVVWKPFFKVLFQNSGSITKCRGFFNAVSGGGATALHQASVTARQLCLSVNLRSLWKGGKRTALPNTRRTADGNTSIFCFFSGRLSFSPTVIHMHECAVNTSAVAFPISCFAVLSPLQIRASRLTISHLGSDAPRFQNDERKCLKRARWRCYSQSKACPWHTSSKCLWCPHAFSGFVPQHCDGHLLGLGEHMFPQRSISKMKNIMSVQLNMQKTNTFLTSSKDILSFWSLIFWFPDSSGTFRWRADNF